MDLNSFIDLQAKLAGQVAPAETPTVDHSDGVNLALDMAKRKGEAPKPEEPKIPSAGAAPVPN